MSDQSKRRWQTDRDRLKAALATTPARLTEQGRQRLQDVSKATQARVQAAINSDPELKQQQIQHMQALNKLRVAQLATDAKARQRQSEVSTRNNLSRWAQYTQEEKDAIVQKRLKTMRDKGITTRHRIREDKS